MSLNSSVGLKSSRKICYESRDRFLECCDRNNGDENNCKKEKKLFDKDCPASWPINSMKRMFCMKLPRMRNVANEVGCRLSVLRTFTSALVSSPSKVVLSAPTRSEPLPLILQRLGVDWSDSLSVEAIINFRKRPIQAADATALSALRRFRLFKSARLYANTLQSCDALPPAVHLELCRLIANFHLEGTNMREDQKLLQFLQATLEQSPSPIRPTASLLLASCSALSSIPPIPANVIERNEVIACLLGRTLHDGHFRMFSSLLHSEREYPIFYSEVVLRLMASQARKTPSIAKLLLERCVAERSAPNALIADHFLRIVRASNVWHISKKAAVSNEGICNVCMHKLNRREELSEDEHLTLHKALLTFLQEESQKFSSGSPAEVRALRAHVNKLSKAEEGSKSLVVDTLNLIHGRSVEPFYKMLLLLLEDFHRIMLITRPGKKNQFMRHLGTLNVSVFVCDKLSEDDLFILLAALEMGPNCYVLSNDQFSDHKHRLGSDLAPLFDKWNASRVVRYFIGAKRYKMPGQFTCFPHCTPSGFHIPVARLISPSIYEHDWICVTKKRPSHKK